MEQFHRAERDGERCAGRMGGEVQALLRVPGRWKGALASELMCKPQKTFLKSPRIMYILPPGVLSRVGLLSLGYFSSSTGNTMHGAARLASSMILFMRVLPRALANRLMRPH